MNAVRKRLRPRREKVAGMKRWLAVAVVAVALLMAVPLMAHATNDYGLTYVGSAKCLSCHGATTGRWQVGRFLETGHAQNVSAVTTATIEPAGTSSALWPSPLAGSATYRFGPADVLWQVNSPGKSHFYVSKYRNTSMGGWPLSTGYTQPKVFWGPADDWVASFSTFETRDGRWNASSGAFPYFQLCGGCHHTGVTRSSDTTYTLASGGEMSRSTETSYTEMGVQCEACHATGSTSGSHWGAGVSVVRSQQTLKSQVCGQCHVSGSANERSWAGASLSSPNGFTPDQDLDDFFTVKGTEFIRPSVWGPAPVIPDDNADFYPTGHNKGMSGGIYNEFQLSGHSYSLRKKDGQLFIPYLQDYCLPCHSGEAFLQSIGYGSAGPNDIGLHKSSVANDVLNIECAVCHSVHSPSGDVLGMRLEGDDLCTKCHVEGVTEIRTGKGLVGVGDTGEWMPGAHCYQCHMPKTNGGYSHRMRIMLPGDAEEWDVPAKGDSCSPCHGGLNRAKLQGYIDTWQAQIKGSHAKATTALNAAKTRTAATTASGKKLVAAAEHNLTLIEKENSWGVHNLPYSRAGVERADYYARSVGARYSLIRATGYSKTAKRAVVFGTLNFGTGAAAGGQRVRIESRLRGSKTWKRIATVTTDSSGRFSHATLPKRGTTTMYRVRWSPKSDVTVTSGTVSVRR